jgi:hypothetical membrane protein
MPAQQSPFVRAGAVAWMVAVQFFITQVVVASAWSRPFSLANDYISDLGNTACGAYPVGVDHLVCSPWHLAMNLSFMTLGVTMIIGAWLTRDAFPAGWVRALAITLFSLAGIGVIVVGIYPENTNNARHVFGAALNFVAGNVAMVVFGLALAQRSSTQRWLIPVSIGAGVLGFTATLLLVSAHYLGLGVGGMERLAAYPMTVWQMIIGAALLRAGAPAARG